MKAYREEILAVAEESEDFIKRWMGDEYVHFIDAIPEIKEFLIELKEKETIKVEEREKKEGRQEIGDVVNLMSLRGGKKLLGKQDKI